MDQLEVNGSSKDHISTSAVSIPGGSGVAGAIGGGSGVGRLGHQLASIGPISTSFGSYLASRLDLLAAPDAMELAALCHADVQRVLESEESWIRRLIRDDLGVRLEEAFSDFERVPFRRSRLEQWHRARMSTGRPVVVKLIRPGLLDRIDPELEHLRNLRSEIQEVTGADSERLISEFEASLRQALDLEREARELARLSRESREIRFLVVPEVRSDWSGSRCLTVNFLEGRTIAQAARARVERAPQSSERFARRLCRVWLSLALTAALFPEEPSERNVLLLENGRIALCGGPFHTPAWGAQEHLRTYLAATTVADQKQIWEAMLELCEERRERENRSLRHQLRHSAPFRDGRWDPADDQLTRNVFAHWHRAAKLDFRPRSTSQAFLRGLFHLTESVRRLAPGVDVTREAFQEFRLRELLSELSALAEGNEWEEILRRQTSLMTDLPRKVDRLLSLTDARDNRDREPSDSNSEDTGTWWTLGALLAASASLALLSPHLSSIWTLGEPLSVLLTLVLGALALAVASRG